MCRRELLLCGCFRWHHECFYVIFFHFFFFCIAFFFFFHQSCEMLDTLVNLPIGCGELTCLGGTLFRHFFSSTFEKWLFTVRIFVLFHFLLQLRPCTDPVCTHAITVNFVSGFPDVLFNQRTKQTEPGSTCFKSDACVFIFPFIQGSFSSTLTMMLVLVIRVYSTHMLFSTSAFKCVCAVFRVSDPDIRSQFPSRVVQYSGGSQVMIEQFCLLCCVFR